MERETELGSVTVKALVLGLASEPEMGWDSVTVMEWDSAKELAWVPEMGWDSGTVMEWGSATELESEPEMDWDSGLAWELVMVTVKGRGLVFAHWQDFAAPRVSVIDSR
jgi:hypothetical protein